MSPRLLAAALAVLTACSPAQARTPARKLPPPDDATRAVAGAVNDFGFDLYARVRGEEGNLVFSPASIGFAVGMVYGGAASETATDIARTMHFDDGLSGDLVHRGFAGLRGRAGELPGDGPKLRIANRIWTRQGMAFAKRFLALTRDRYGAEAENADFTQAEKARQRINDWVAKITSDRILNLVPAGAIDGSTVMVLVNAIWFKGTWKQKFDARRTADAPFEVPGAEPVQVKTMHRHGPARFAHTDGVRLLELDYAGSDLAMVFLLGDEGLAEVESRLTSAQLATWLAGLREVDEVDIALPRFETTQSLPLGALLTQLGMGRLFGPEADLSPMLASGDKGLFASDAFHKAFVTVNEEGAEAAAATAIVVTEAAAIEPPRFRADRPFLWLIRDKQTGLVLFIGRVVDPR
jgi:serpin B